MNTQGSSIPKPCPKVEVLDMQTDEFCILSQLKLTRLSHREINKINNITQHKLLQAVFSA